jgi:hypothetical protein
MKNWLDGQMMVIDYDGFTHLVSYYIQDRSIDSKFANCETDCGLAIAIMATEVYHTFRPGDCPKCFGLKFRMREAIKGTNE